MGHLGEWGEVGSRVSPGWSYTPAFPLEEKHEGGLFIKRWTEQRQQKNSHRHESVYKRKKKQNTRTKADSKFKRKKENTRGCIASALKLIFFRLNMHKKIRKRFKS